MKNYSIKTRTFFGSLRPRTFRFHKLEKPQHASASTKCVQQSDVTVDGEPFRYTSGRWIFNEHLRLAERFLEFDVSALQNVISAASRHSISDLRAFRKLSEGGFNRVFEATFSDGKHVIARLPYPSTVPEHYTVASEAATLDYLRLHGIFTPEVYAWCSTKANPVGTEYIIMEKLDGIPLGDKWFTLTPKEQHKVMNQIIEWEARLMSLQFPASGSLYYTKDLSSESRVQLAEPNGMAFCIGPAAHYSWWHDKRDLLNIDRGPSGERELAWTKAYAKPRLSYDRLYRETYHFKPLSPDSHITDLTNYLKMIPCLGYASDSTLNRPVMRHPDLQPNNILVSDANDILGIIDWQHCSILPLGIAAGIPAHFQNYGDPESEMLKQPQLSVPPDYDSLPKYEQASLLETRRKRMIHFLYAALTKRLNKEHYDAIFDQSVILRQRLFKNAGTPWEGDSISLRAELIRSIQNWATITQTTDPNQSKSVPPATPVDYSEETVRETLDLDARQKEADIAMEQMRDALGVDILGWVPNDDYDAVKGVAHDMKTKMLQAAETPEDIIGVRDHFPFDDFDEAA
ncbi:kinase-like protein [Aspergillus sclerotioniger CBS 115572]|uniref:Kinase-like protein n=1 Tax=Aspergillus sclerotioniger CBS 115572 TaxID=1450535 RepID=A0A317WYF2_9EURO|nr:kinase-like protein [Aspergillus sclerotioniger CBS 115572]PWY90362.1 kinase-like protein [Aspergillus sclerotioniger CBS 115572]